MQFGPRFLSLDTPRVMGVLNVTPDSFYDGGQHFQHSTLSVHSCLNTAEAMVASGADFIDVGGESTRPGAEPVGEQQEMDRVLPVVEAIAGELDVIISVDTSNARLISEAAALGAGLINDVRALERPGALAAAAQTALPVCLMHMRGAPKSMQDSPNYVDVVAEVSAYLSSRLKACLDIGIKRDNVLFDPGIGFGKTDEHNLVLLRQLPLLLELGHPVLVGVSRKSLIGRLLGREPEDRLAGSVAFAQEALHRGAKILRVHDVAETADMVKVYEFMNKVEA